MNELISKMQTLVSYYNLHKHKLTAENYTYLIGQLDIISEGAQIELKEYYRCLEKQKKLKKSIAFVLNRE